MTSWREEKLDVDRVERITGEWDAGHIPGSVHRPYHDIDALPAGIDPGRPAGQVIHVVDGGVPHWRRAGWPIEQRAHAAA